MDNQTEQIEKYKKEYFKRQKWRRLQFISMSFCFIVIALCCAGILFCAGQQRVQSEVKVDYARPEYYVTLDSNGGSACAGFKMQLGEYYSVLPTPTRAGYTFKGWNGKNLVNIPDGVYSDYVSVSNGVITIKKTTNSNTTKVLSALQLKPNTQYTVSCKIQGTFTGRIYAFLMSNNSGDGSIYQSRIDSNGFYKCTYTTSNTGIDTDKGNIYIVQGSGANSDLNMTSDQVVISDIMLCEGTSTTYEPYYITNSTRNTTVGNHTLTAQWTPNNYTVTLYENKNILYGGGLTTEGELKSWDNVGPTTIATQDGLNCVKISGALKTTIYPYQSILDRIKIGTEYIVGIKSKVVNYVAGTTNPTAMLYTDGYYNDSSGTRQWYSVVGAREVSGYSNKGWTDVFYHQVCATGYPAVTSSNVVGASAFMYVRDCTGDIYFRDYTIAEATNTTKSITYGGALGSTGILSYDGFTFNGYFTQPVGGVQIYTSGGSPIKSVSGYTDANGNWIKSADTKLYGQWTPNNYTYTFDQQSGSGGTSSISVKFNSRTANITVPTRAGYSFGGYYTAANGGGTQYYNASGVCLRPLTTAGNMTLYAKWTANSYTINLDKQGGSDGTSTTSATYNAKLGTISPPVRTGYTFAGYYTGKNGSGTQLYNASGVGQITWTTVGGTTAYANWTANKYTVTFDKQSGSGGTDSLTATFGSSMDTISIPSRTGYTFAGYYTATGGGGTQYFNGSGTCTRGWDIAKATTLYANWTANTIKITLNKNGGSGGTDSFYYKYATNKFYSNEACTTEITSITLPTRTGYTFSNYYGDGSCGGGNGENYYNTNFASDLCTDIYKNATLYAKWNANQYTVTTNLNGGTLNGKAGNATNTIYTDEAMAFGVPTRTGYTFAGWSFSGGTVNSGASYNAFGRGLNSNPAFNGTNSVGVYNNKGNGTVTHSVVQGSAPNNTGYYLEITTAGEATPGLGGYTHSTSSYANAVFTTVIIAKIPVGYTLQWASNSIGGGSSSWLTSQAGTGTWQRYIYKVTCGSNGSYSSTNYYYLTGTAGTVEKPVKWQVAYSQVFDSTGATSNASNTAQILTCTGGVNITATANWTANTYTVTYNANGGSGTTANSTHTYDTAKALTKNGFTRTGYTFDGWATSASGGKVYSDQQSVTNLATSGTYTLYAHWNPNQYTLTFDKQDGSGGAGSVTATYDSTVPSISSNLPSKTGYTFGGYFTATNGGGTQYYNASGNGTRAWTTASGQTLYAYWIPKTYTVTYNANGGTGTGVTDTVTFGTAYKARSNTMFSRTGYSFAGWNENSSGTGSDWTSWIGKDWTWTYDKNITLYAKWTANSYTLTINYTVPRCGTCNAVGTVNTWVPCSNCGGNGTVAGQVTCGSCNGSGGYYDDCWKCDGSGSVSSSCSTCNSTGSLTCPSCNGSGKHRLCGGSGNGGSCSGCGGTGECPGCGGSGEYKCSKCGGSGSISSTCSRCDGDGYTSSDWNNCSKCSGSGKVSGQVQCGSCKGNKGSNVSGTCTTCNSAKTNFSGGSTSVTVTYGQTLPNITIKSFTGYDISVPNYASNGTSTATWTTAGNATWNASFSAKSYTMTLSASNGNWSGTASGTTSIAFGTSVSLTFTNTTGYDNKTSSISGYVSASGSTSASVSFVMPAQNISISGSGGGSNNSCLAYNTPILTADGWKMIQDITYSDRLIRFNHDTGQIDTAYASWISKAVVSKRVMEVTFSDGETIKFVGDHAVFSLDQNKYVAVTDPAKFYIGTRVLKYIANDCANTSCSTCSSCTCSTGYESCATWGEAVVTGICYIEEETPAYSIITSGMWNCFAGNILTTVPNTIIFQNMYGFKKNLTYASSIRQKVLNGTYDKHLFTEKELKDMGWTDRDIVGFRGREWKILIDYDMLDMDFMINILLNEVANNENERVLPPVNEKGNFVYVVTTSQDVMNDNYNSQDFFFEEYTHYILPNIEEEGFVGWLSSSDGKIYYAGDTYKVRTNTHFTAIYST